MSVKWDQRKRRWFEAIRVVVDVPSHENIGIPRQRYGEAGGVTASLKCSRVRFSREE